ncbi:ribose-phosphate pyrophosphokinase [symbiont of Argiope bruennichi]|uniref:ribose-phosphate diphosphokinase n=1 Tax=symbiont of Argiope bruennichi TaxID=2810479 RepID=UPI003DA5ABAE
MNNNDFVVFGLSDGKHLAKSVCDVLNFPLGKSKTIKFADGEILTEIGESVRNKDVFVFQSFSSPANDNIMEFLIFVDSLRRASAKNIYAVIPYYGYARQDRKAHGRQPITARLIADLLERVGVKRVTTFDLHSSQIQGFFDIAVDDLRAGPIILSYIVKKYQNEIKNKELTVVSPDQGGVKRARLIASELNVNLSIIDKRRNVVNDMEVMNILGNVENKVCLMIDDMIDTGNTIIKGAKALKNCGAKSVIICCTHPVFSKDCIINLQNSIADEVITTDTIFLPENKHFEKLKIVSVKNFLAELLETVSKNGSISDIYKKYSIINS